MKTLNINKLTILFGLFFVSVFFTTSASAACTLNSDGTKIEIANSTAPVSSTVATEDDAAGTAKQECPVTPAIYKIRIYKFGICTADPDLNDLTSCKMFFESTAGIDVDIKAGVSSTLPIPEFYIEPGTYPYMYVQLSNNIGMKWTATMSQAVTGADAAGTAGAGTTCWTTDTRRVNRYQAVSGSNAVTTVHGASGRSDAKSVDCGDSSEFASGYAFTYEVMARFIENDADTDAAIYCSAALGTNGDYVDFVEVEGTGQTAGVNTVSLLNAADGFATSCTDSAKIAWTTALVTPYTITEDSSFTMNIKATSANDIQFLPSANKTIKRIISGAPKISLVVN